MMLYRYELLPIEKNRIGMEAIIGYVESIGKDTSKLVTSKDRFVSLANELNKAAQNNDYQSSFKEEYQMRKLHMITVCLLIIAALLSGCVGDKAAQQPSQTTIPQGEGLQGNISVPGEKDLLIEEPLSSTDENVDMGSLI